MKIAFFDTHGFEKEYFLRINLQHGHQITFLDSRLTEETVGLASEHEVVCAFVNDLMNRTVIQKFASLGIKCIALRSAGFNHVDLRAAREFGIKVCRVPEYSPYAVAEHTLALILCMNRKIHRAYNRIREGNFSLNGLVGFDLHGKTVGIVGTGKIGSILSKILLGFSCKVLAVDQIKNQELLKMGIKYVDQNELLELSDIISLNVPLNPTTKHWLNEESLSKTKKGVMIVNTGRGALIDTKALIKFLKSGHIGQACLDVYEEEEGIFFEDHSGQILQDDQLARLLTFPNVLLTSHQAFLTREALENIASTTLSNVTNLATGRGPCNEVSA